MSNTTLDSLGAAIDGVVIGPTDEGYDEARRVWNGDIDRRPSVIVRCAGPADVQAAVRYARQHDLAATVRGGGHAVAGHAVADGALTIDLSAMTDVSVDPGSRTARVAGGALWSHVDAAAQAHGLTVTGGVVSHTGVAGLTLGGGIGHLMRKFGLTIDSLLSCEVVTAEGDVIDADESSHPELFWGLRGGGGNFGIVTEFRFRLHPVGPSVYAGLTAWPMEDAPQVLRFMRDFITTAPDDVGLMANLRLAPPLPVIPEAVRGTPIVVLLAVSAASPAEGIEQLRAVREFGRPVVDGMQVQPYCSFQQMLDASLPHGDHYYWKARKLPALTDAAIDTIVGGAGGLPTTSSAVPIFWQGGAVSRVPDDATAYPSRAPQHDINVVAAWTPEDPLASRHRAWVRQFHEALAPHSEGVYVNFLSDEPDDVVARVYGPEKYARLRALKRRYDPTNFFHHNSNIPPA